MDVVWMAASGSATVHSWTVAHHAYHPSFKSLTPYTVVTADLPEGIRVLARLRHAEASKLRIGMPLQIGFEKISSDRTIAEFAPA
jgi:uncharacterized OB-fold protein